MTPCVPHWRTYKSMPANSATAPHGSGDSSNAVNSHVHEHVRSVGVEPGFGLNEPEAD